MATARLLLVLTLVAGVAAVGQLAHPPGFADAAQLAAGAAGSVICLAAARSRSGPARRARLFLAAALAGWATVHLWWLLAGTTGRSPVPSLVLPLFLLGALLTMTAVLRRPVPASPTRDRIVLLIDSILISASLLALCWSVLPRQVFIAIGPAIAFPIADLVLLTMALLLLASRPAPDARPPLRLLALALLALGAADAAHLLHPAGGAMELAGHLLGPVLIILAALCPQGPPEETAATADTDLTHLLLPYVPVVATGVVIAIRTGAGGRLTPFEAYLGWLALGLVVARQMFTIVDNSVLLVRISEGRRRLHHQAYHDPLTGLANRALFRDRLTRALQSGDAPPALLFADLDDFKVINDSFGHGVGDRLLRAVADRLLDCVPEGDLVCRLGGDEFAVLLERHPAEAEAIGERILAELGEPFDLDGHSLSVGASIGMVLPDPALSADALLRRADAAMYAGKRRGKGVLTSYSGPSAGGTDADLPHLLAQALSGPPGAAGFDVHYQPVVRLSDGFPVAVEALARWTDPVAGVIEPAVFVPIAERTGLIAVLDDFVLDRACADAAVLARAYGRPIDVHVNVSAARLGRPELEDAIVKALRRHGMRPSRLIVEITETRRIPDLTRAAAVVNRLRGYGVRVALDDFGSGFNALTQLHSLPVDIVKLDAALTDVDVAPAPAGALCRSVLAICAELAVTVIAEGIETPSQARAIAELGCRFGQGYLFGAPGPLPVLITT